MFEENILERGEPTFAEVENPHFAPPSPPRRPKQIETRAPLAPDIPSPSSPNGRLGQKKSSRMRAAMGAEMARCIGAPSL
jgi:hypothetical protein